MRKCKCGFVAILFGFIHTIYCAGAQSGTFTVDDFLDYSEEGRDGYVSISVTMAGVIATQFEGNQAECIDRWGKENREDGYKSLLKVMRDYPDYHPQGIILAVLEKACGKFADAER